MQINTQNSRGEMLAYNGVDIASGASGEIARVIVAAGGSAINLNLSLPDAADWASSYFTVEVDRGRFSMPIIDQTAQFINQPWKIPFDLKAGDVVTILGTNGGTGAIRFAAYVGVGRG